MTVWPLTIKVAPSSWVIVNAFGDVTEIKPENSQIVGSIDAPGALSTRLLIGNVFDAIQFAIVAEDKLKFTPLVVNVTSAFACVHAPAPLWQVPSARLAGLAPVALFTIASVDLQPQTLMKSAAQALAAVNAKTPAPKTAMRKFFVLINPFPPQL